MNRPIPSIEVANDDEATINAARARTGRTSAGPGVGERTAVPVTDMEPWTIVPVPQASLVLAAMAR